MGLLLSVMIKFISPICHHWLEWYDCTLLQVSVMEGSQGVWMVKNLSVHYAATEDVAQNLLLQGQANRRVAATAVHDRSSRSHAVFTIQLSAKRADSDVVVK